MGLQAVSILTEGVWASLTGGWYYDKKQSHFSNLFHLYIWLIFLCFPFINYLFFNTWISWILYCLIIGLIFTIVKSINEYFHRVFDTGKCIKDVENNESTFQDPVMSSLMCNGGDGDNCGESMEKETLEMVAMSHNSNNDDVDLQSQQCSNKIEENVEKNNNSDALNQESNLQNSQNDDNCSNNEITSKTIDLKADVHYNQDTDSSSFGNLSLLFKNDNESKSDDPIMEDIIKMTGSGGSETSFSNITAIHFTKGGINNSTNNCTEISGNHKNVNNNTTFRRARSEIETIKNSDKSTSSSSKASLIPPSHPVSLEMINSKTINDDKSITVPLLDNKNRFRDSNKPKSSLLSQWIDENENLDVMGRIEENIVEKQPQPSTSLASCSHAYIKKDCDSSEDGDESEISLCTANDSIKINKKLSKQPVMRKARFSSSSASNHRKRSKSSGTGAGRSADWSSSGTHKSLYHELNERFRPKQTNNTSDEEDVNNNEDDKDKNNKEKHGKHLSMPHRLQQYQQNDHNYYSSSSSSLPSSSSSYSASSSSMTSVGHQRIKDKGDFKDQQQFSMNFPSTSSGIVSSSRAIGSKRLRHGSDRKPQYSNNLARTIWNSSVEEEGCSTLTRYEKHMKLRQLINECNAKYPMPPPQESNFDHTDLRYLYNLEKRSMSIHRDGGESSKNSIVCRQNSPKIFGEILANPNTHLATSHEDTTVGAVHLFQDERGNWFTYTFDENSTGVARGLCPPNPFTKFSSSSANNNDSVEKFKISNNNNSSGGALIPSNSIFYLNNNSNANNSLEHQKISSDVGLTIFNSNNGGCHSSQTPDSINSINPLRNNNNNNNMFFDPLTMFDPNSDPSRAFFLDASIASEIISSLNNPSFSHSFQRSQQQLKPSQYYEMNLMNLKTIKIRFDRLSLLAFLDRNLTTLEMIFSIILAILVSIFSSILLSKEFFHDIRLFVFCFVVAGSQYTLLKSVQPDAASPTHGFNRIAIYSRPIYFCLVSAIILLSNEYHHSAQTWIDDCIFEIYGFNLINRDLFSAISNISQTLILIFPLLFMFGLLPQFNTFVMYIFEHLDIYMFGGTASTMGMISATYSIIRSILAISFLYVCARLFQIKEQHRTTSFSVFCGILVACSYLFSRSPSDPSLLWNVIYEFLRAIKNFFISLITNSKSKSTTADKSTTLGSSNPLPPVMPATPISGMVTNSQNDSLKSTHSKTNESSIATTLTAVTNTSSPNDTALIDPLPEKLKNIALQRFESDFITCIFITISVFSVHVSSIFKLQPFFNDYIKLLVIHWSFSLHYLIPQFRKQLPWLLFSSPICKSYEYKKFEVTKPAKNMWFEKLQAWLWLIEKNILYPLLFLGYITTDCPLLIKNYGPNFGLFLLVLFGFKCLRSSFNDPSHNFIIVIFTHLFFSYDFRLYINGYDNIFLLNYFIMSFVYYKVEDFLLKFRFVITYVAPWQIAWGSAFHAFAQPFSVPHSALLLVQIFVSSLLSAPLQPILGSAIFFTSYVRPIKFWERDYNTKRVDHSNTRLASQIDKAQIGSDDNNLNSIFYEHLTRSLQHSLYGDLILGRWGDVSQGDCFVLASDNLNCLIHIIELGNGFVTFQVRGLEFRGTYCQQREVEAITENVSDDDGCCCCETPRFNGVLSANAAFNQRWLSWEVTHTNYVLEGYSISEHIASTIVQPYDLRKALITYYVKSIIYFCITYKNFPKWLENDEIRESLSYLNDKNFVDLDPTFNYNIDDDYDIMASGITRASFKQSYIDWIRYCLEQTLSANPVISEVVKKNEELVVSLCLGLSLLARRALGTASHHNSALMNVEFFLYGFHALFKGDFRIHCSRDEWVFQDMDFLNKVVSPSVRMSLKLHQDQFINYEEYENPKTLFESITQYQKSMVISHEADPIWRKAILSNVPSLLALRHVFDEGTDHYKVIMLNKRFLNFRIIKINRECVRGLWAGQQQELIFLRNRNPERGSIQNAKQVLRNIINSSCDQPIGYPIYVSPLTTSFSETSQPLNQIIGPSLSFSMFKRAIVGFYNKILNRCNEVCTGSNSRPSELNVFQSGGRLTKSESSDKGLDDSISAKGSLIVSTHSQIVQFSNYSQYLKKQVLKNQNDEETMHVNSPASNLVNQQPQQSSSSSITTTTVSAAATNKNVSLLQNSLPSNLQSQQLSTDLSSNVNGQQQLQSDISLEQSNSKSLIMEKGYLHPKGDAV